MSEIQEAIEAVGISIVKHLDQIATAVENSVPNIPEPMDVAQCWKHTGRTAYAVCIFCADASCLKCLRVVFVQPVQGAPYQQAFQCNDCYNEKYTDERGITIIPAEINYV